MTPDRFREHQLNCGRAGVSTRQGDSNRTQIMKNHPKEREKKENPPPPSQKKKHVSMSNASAPAMSLEDPGIDPGTSRMLSGRSTI